MPQIFIAYSRKDLPFVEQLAKDLKNSGFDVWFDVSGLGGGSRWGAEIENSIKNSQFVIVVLSPESIESEWVERETLLAGKLKRKIIPLVYRTSEIPLIYLNLQHIDVQGENYQQNFPEILRALSVDPSTVTLPSKKAKKALSLRTEYWVAIIGAAATLVAAVIPMIWSAVSASDQNGNLAGETITPPGLVQVVPSTQDMTSSVITVTDTATPEPSATVAVRQTLTPTTFPSELDIRGAQMVLIPSGIFSMGSDNGDENESPIHKVGMSDYYIDKFEVTNVLYRACMEAGGCKPPKSIDSTTHGAYYANPDFDNFPVINVDWNMAAAYCKWRGEGTRLPTEAEWEKAARGDTLSTYPWGEEIECLYANYWSVGGRCNADTVEVGSYEAGKSPYGVYDMAGNVWEWVADWYQKTYYRTLGEGVFDPTGPSIGDGRVLRGGSWLTDGSTLRSANRSTNTATRYNVDVGFRCARDVNP